MSNKPAADEAGEFQRLAVQKRPGLLSEFFQFAMQNRKWWLLPMVLILLVIGILIVLGGTAAAPFVYTLF